MADDEKRKLPLVDIVGIGNLLEHLVAQDSITCDERDKIIQRIAKDNGLADHVILGLVGYMRSKDEVIERAAHRDATLSQQAGSDVSYLSLTEVVRAHSSDAPGYVIQSWLRSGNTLAFLNLWEMENNPNYRKEGYKELFEKKKTASFTLTPKLWITQTSAIGVTSKQGKSGGTFAHPMIACEFASWLVPEFKMLLLKLSLERKQLTRKR